MANNRIAEDYKLFVANLYHCINRNANLDDIAQLVFLDSYCKYLCNKVARKYQIDSDDVHAQLVLDVLGNKLFPNITDGSQQFSGRYFHYRIINIAKSLQHHDALDITEKTIADTLESDTNLAEEAVRLHTMHEQYIGYNELKQTKIAELHSYKEQLDTWHKINLDELSTIVELSTENIARELNIPRHKLVRHPEHYKEPLINLIDSYIQLVERWFATRYSYLNNLAEEYGSLLKVYQRIKLNYSYSKFAELANSMTIWQLEEIRLQLESN